MASPLEDLDELTLRCRDEKTRRYITEAVASYRAGAFRSAIVATWIAVCFDVIEKIRELAIAGDKEAEVQLRDIDDTRRDADLKRALAFEREVLNLAKDKFELISPLEYIDLERLQADRNRCAHPSLTSDDQAYVPSAELARLHIHSAVTHLLQHPPLQGKYALDRLVLEIESEYFPSTSKEARVAFGSGPLRRPRESLVRNLVLVLCKILLKESPDLKRRLRVAAAIQAILELHPTHYSKTMAERLPLLFRAVPDAELRATTKFFESVPDSWQYLDADVKLRLQNYVASLPTVVIGDVDFLLRYVPLQQQARSRVLVATREELRESSFFFPPTEVIDRYISIYLESSTFEKANEWAKHVVIYTDDFTAEQVRKLLSNVAKNDQVLGSFQLSHLISSLRARKKLTNDEFESLLQLNGLEEHALASEEDS